MRRRPATPPASAATVDADQRLHPALGGGLAAGRRCTCAPSRVEPGRGRRRAVSPRTTPDGCGCCGWNGSPRPCCSCLFDGIPSVVHIEEPRQGVQFGFDDDRPHGDQNARRCSRATRTTFDDLPGAAGDVPFRSAAAAGVVDIQELERRARRGPAAGAARRRWTAREYALQLVRFPYRQVWGDRRRAPSGRRRLQADHRLPDDGRRRSSSRRAAVMADRFDLARDARRAASLDRAVRRARQARRRPRHDRHVGPAAVPATRGSWCRSTSRRTSCPPAAARPRSRSPAAPDDPAPFAAGRRRSRPACTCTGRCPTR